MMQRSRIFIRDNTQPADRRTLSPYLVSDLNVHVNGYYLNLCGALDNLAWVVTYELALQSDIDENTRWSRMFANLFGRDFRKSLRKEKGDIVQILDENIDWNDELRKFRDPAAHRIPIYMSPSVMDESDMEKFREIERGAELSEEERGGRTRASYLIEARSLGRYEPIMVTSSPDGLVAHSFPD